MSAHGWSRRLTPNAQTALQAACWHLGAAFEAASVDLRTFSTFLEIAITRLARESLRLLDRERPS